MIRTRFPTYLTLRFFTSKNFLKVYNSLLNFGKYFNKVNIIHCMNLITIFVVALVAIIIIIPGPSAVSEG